jgi:hypothetical protein
MRSQNHHKTIFITSVVVLVTLASLDLLGDHFDIGWLTSITKTVFILICILGSSLLLFSVGFFVYVGVLLPLLKPGYIIIRMPLAEAAQLKSEAQKLNQWATDNTYPTHFDVMDVRGRPLISYGLVDGEKTLWKFRCPHKDIIRQLSARYDFVEFSMK